ncbi:MAG TPA: DUF1294 domain-containing protein [Pseudomonadales bacterium]|nr:DUF1294 domain-containing protein [Pseudomonadales bacterium]
MTAGVVVEWRDARGFGFVEADGGGPRHFLHVRALDDRRLRPRVGMRVRFDSVQDADGRWQAHAVRPLTLGRLAVPRPLRLLWRLLVPLALCLALAFAGRLPWTAVAFVLTASLVSLVLYAVDKSAAAAGRSRIAERTLHLWSLVGGWPGALYAQPLLRHKTRKRPFRIVFAATVLLNLALLAALGTAAGREVAAPVDARLLELLGRLAAGLGLGA